MKVSVLFICGSILGAMIVSIVNGIVLLATLDLEHLDFVDMGKPAESLDYGSETESSLNNAFRTQPSGQGSGLNDSWTSDRSLQQALAIEDPTERESVLLNLASSLAVYDPVNGLRWVEQLPSALQSAFRSTLVREWAFADPESFLSHAESVGIIDELVEGLALLVSTDPYRVWRIVSISADPSNRRTYQLYLSSIQAMVEASPTVAVSRLGPTLNGPQRGLLLTTIAQAYARRDSESAIVWANSLQPPSHAALSTILSYIASTDLERAYQVALTAIDDPAYGERVLTGVASEALEGGQHPEVIADFLVSQGNTRVSERLLRDTLAYWASSDPERVASWISANAVHVDVGASQYAARGIARQNPELAATLVRQIPHEFRDAWLLEVGRSYGSADPQGALRWISEFQGEPGYDGALGEILTSAALSDVTIAAEYIENLDNASSLINSALAVADALLEQSPLRAMDWALNLQDEEVARAVLGPIAARWVNDSPEEAEEWADRMSNGQARDQVMEAFGRTP